MKMGVDWVVFFHFTSFTLPQNLYDFYFLRTLRPQLRRAASLGGVVTPDFLR